MADDTLGLILAATTEDDLPRTHIAGVNIWTPAHVDDVDRTPEHRRKLSEKWHREFDERGIEVACEKCGRTFRVHPVMAGRAFTCSRKCKNRSFDWRRSGRIPARPIWIPRSKAHP